MPSFPHHIFRKYDIRGAYGVELTDDVAFGVGRAFGAMCRERRGVDSPLVSVGMDARTHSPAVRRAFSSGLAAAGCRWLSLGLCPTPLTYFSAFEMELDGFAMITASHNPPGDNGMKLGIGRKTIHSGDIAALGRMASGAAGPGDAGSAAPEGEVDIVSVYREKMLEEFAPLGDLVRQLGRPVRVVVDSGNGTAGVVLPRILIQLGFSVRELYSEPDGSFPNHHPDPTLPEALEVLRKEVHVARADVGLSFDGDADRIGVLDERGGVVWGDMLLLVLGRALIEEWKRGGGGGEPPLVISEVKASSLLYDGIEGAGGRALMWKTGHSLIKAKMLETGAALAGEMSGHLFFADRYHGYDDALYGALRLLEVYVRSLAEGRCRTFSDLLSGLPDLFVTPEIRVDCPEERKFEVVDLFRKGLQAHMGGGGSPHVRDFNGIDGVRARFDQGWGLVRASNTQPVLVLRFEGPDEATVALYRGLFQRLIDGAMG